MRDPFGLQQQLTGLPSQQAGGAADLLEGEDAGQQGADDAADGMHAKRVQAVVIAEHDA